ncbi:MAG: GNAT family N-acetyltransferase [Chitinophagales bacterium]|nr:GNAT family N-acetyltransferase [Chitinophagales bacterium]HNI43559.1 GNAT family N-acetyltransferase [Chitinophagales bacterium]HNL08740.1 GNAT family N-acetyltransferase [Chitinophagales bacterium]
MHNFPHFIHIGRAIMGDLTDIVLLVQEVVRQMNSMGNYQWNEHYPSVELLSKDIAQGNLFVAITTTHSQKTIAGIITIDTHWAEEYLQIGWQQPLETSFFVHRLGVLPAHQHQKIAQQLLLFADRWALDNHKTAIKLDTYEENTPAENLFFRQGYQLRGAIVYENYEGKYRCYEKCLLS